jgi:addiction module HigA family antidote
MTKRSAAPIHPGEVLVEEFLRPLNLSPGSVARAVGVPRTRIERVANEEAPVTADTALRLAKFFGTDPMFWMGLQAEYDLGRAAATLGVDLRKIKSTVVTADPK